MNNSAQTRTEQSWQTKTLQKFHLWSHCCHMFRCNSAHFTALKLCRERVLCYRVCLKTVVFICILLNYWKVESCEKSSYGGHLCVVRSFYKVPLSVSSDVKSETNTLFRKLLYAKNETKTEAKNEIKDTCEPFHQYM